MNSIHGGQVTPGKHAPEVATVAAWGSYFAGVAGDTARESSLKSCANQFYTTFSHVVTYWTNPAGPPVGQDSYRIDPHRKYNWWFKNSSGFGWAMGGGASQPSPSPSPSPSPTPDPGCGVSTPGSTFNQSFAAQTGEFTVVADATPAAGGDSGVGVNSNPAVNETNSFSTAATVRFNAANQRIEARSGVPIPRPRSRGWPGSSTGFVLW